MYMVNLCDNSEVLTLDARSLDSYQVVCDIYSCKHPRSHNDPINQ